jgi:phage terminase large subunit-like protein
VACHPAAPGQADAGPGRRCVTATARRLAEMPEAERRRVLCSLPEGDLQALEYHWGFWARADQLPPPGDWRVWILQAGRGAGKTRSAAEFIRSMVEAGRYRSIAIVGPTAAAIRRDMVEGGSGLLNIGPPWSRPEYQPSSLRIVWPNGAIAHLLSAEEPDRIRGLNADLAWADELASWANQQTSWDMLMLALRLSGPKGDAARIVVSTTPRPSPLLVTLLGAPTTVVTKARTMDNAANLDASTLSYLQDRYGGTRLGRQELDGELIGDIEGALWTRQLIDECRIRRGTEPERMRRVVVAIDPPGASGKTSAECGLIVAGIGPDRHGYIMADLSGRYSPEQWASKAIGAFHSYKADRIVAEKNFGGEMVESTLRSIDRSVPLKMVTASRGKQIRAEPIAAFYEQHKVHHIGEFPDLEDQMCSWDPAASGPSPDRVDSAVWALTELMSGPGPMRISQAALERSRQMIPRHAF